MLIFLDEAQQSRKRESVQSILVLNTKYINGLQKSYPYTTRDSHWVLN